MRERENARAERLNHAPRGLVPHRQRGTAEGLCVVLGCHHAVKPMENQQFVAVAAVRRHDGGCLAHAVPAYRVEQLRAVLARAADGSPALPRGQLWVQLVQSPFAVANASYGHVAQQHRVSTAHLIGCAHAHVDWRGRPARVVLTPCTELAKGGDLHRRASRAAVRLRLPWVAIVDIAAVDSERDAPAPRMRMDAHGVQLHGVRVWHAALRQDDLLLSLRREGEARIRYDDRTRHSRWNGAREVQRDGGPQGVGRPGGGILVTALHNEVGLEDDVRRAHSVAHHRRGIVGKLERPRGRLPRVQGDHVNAARHT
mmetsp:Transcript_7873/g.31961  ORF Transcript_7873/g.31961 Transcript_7873/m.31961 type:complete len:313 (-) Transcript_7873:283-1221(-)